MWLSESFIQFITKEHNNPLLYQLLYQTFTVDSVYEVLRPWLSPSLGTSAFEVTQYWRLLAEFPVHI